MRGMFNGNPIDVSYRQVRPLRDHPVRVAAYLTIYGIETHKVIVQNGNEFPFGDWETDRKVRSKILKELLKAWLASEDDENGY